MPEPLAGPRVPTLRVIVIVLLLTFSGATLVGSVVPARDGLHRTQEMLDRQIDENARSKERLEELDKEGTALRTDPWVNQRIIRTFRIRDEDEVVVIPSAIATDAAPAEIVLRSSDRR